MMESADLIRRFHAGDSGIFEHLIEDHQEDVYTLCLRNCGDTEIAEDMAEKIFLAAHRALYRLDPSTPLRTWLFQLSIATLADTELAETVSSQPSDQQSAMVNAVLRELDAPFRFAVILRDVLQLTESEVAEILCLPLGTVRSRIHRGRLTMARSLAKQTDV